MVVVVGGWVMGVGWVVVVRGMVAVVVRVVGMVGRGMEEGVVVGMVGMERVVVGWVGLVGRVVVVGRPGGLWWRWCSSCGGRSSRARWRHRR